ncbi:7-carboxy-7-deazaguanine synthase QueE [Bacteroidia bacterium]|jgi:7-carboxy-7-deazaguanine synthase|nr:7-carboxy-7-deazaguanine synthase QueE [Bacteroidia bacterium]
MIDFPVMEYFYSIQGEGVYTGQPAFFVRLGGCDVGCVWCDVKDSWDADKHPKKSIAFLLDEAKKYPSRILILTGGEPAMYDLTQITQAFKKEGFRVHIETSGAYELVGDFDWVTFSPKKFKAPIAIAAIQADELKVVVLNKSDIGWAEEHQKMVPDTCKLYLQPEWDKREVTEKIIFDYVLKNPNWFVSLQTHKYLGVD